MMLGFENVYLKTLISMYFAIVYIKLLIRKIKSELELTLFYIYLIYKFLLVLALI